MRLSVYAAHGEDRKVRDRTTARHNQGCAGWWISKVDGQVKAMTTSLMSVRDRQASGGYGSRDVSSQETLDPWGYAVPVATSN